MVKFILLVTFFAFSSAYACECVPRETTKKYQSIEDKWYGKKFNYSCVYDCRERGYKESVTGTHSKTIVGKERGNEIVCDGTVYAEQYVTSVGWFIYKFVRNEKFKAKESSSPEVIEWAERNCQK